MSKAKPEYIRDEDGAKKAIVLPISQWHQIKADLEELDEIRAYDKAKSELSEPVPFDEAVASIQKSSKH